VRTIVNTIEPIKESVLAEVQSIRGERAGTSLPVSLNEALSRILEISKIPDIVIRRQSDAFAKSQRGENF
jgi:hypothetical protein